MSNCINVGALWLLIESLVVCYGRPLVWFCWHVAAHWVKFSGLWLPFVHCGGLWLRIGSMLVACVVSFCKLWWVMVARLVGFGGLWSPIGLVVFACGCPVCRFWCVMRVRRADFSGLWLPIGSMLVACCAPFDWLWWVVVAHRVGVVALWLPMRSILRRVVSHSVNFDWLWLPIGSVLVGCGRPLGWVCLHVVAHWVKFGGFCLSNW